MSGDQSINLLEEFQLALGPIVDLVIDGLVYLVAELAIEGLDLSQGVFLTGLFDQVGLYVD